MESEQLAEISNNGSVYTVSFSPDETKLCSGNVQKVILTNLNIRNKKTVFMGHKRVILGSSFSSDGNLLATCSADKTIRIWNRKGTLREIENNCTALNGHSLEVNCVLFLQKNSKKVISGSDDTTIKIWDIEQKKEISTLKDCEGVVWSVDFLPDHQTIVSGDNNHQIRFFDFRSGKCEKILDHHKKAVYSVQFHPNSFSLASGSGDKTIKTFDIRTFELLQNYEVHSKSVNSICFHPTGGFLMSGSDDKTLKIIELSKKKVVYTLEDHSHWVLDVQFSPSGQYFASGGKDKKAFVWTFPHGEYLMNEFEEEERVSKLSLDNEIFPSFRITLSNKTLNLWKSVFVSPKIDQNTTEYDMPNRSLSLVEEELLFKIMIGRKLEKTIPPENLGDHFIFFQELGMKYETKMIVDKVLQIQELGKCFQIFCSFCQKYESSDIKDWFSLTEEKIIEFLETTFNTSFGLQLFLRIGQLKEQFYQSTSKLLLKKNLGTVLYHVNNVEKELSIYEHPDFKGFDPSEFELETKMKKLRNGLNSNLSVTSCDNQIFRVHREILNAKSNFFSRMFRFHGRERAEILENGTVKLEEICSEDFEILLESVNLKNDFTLTEKSTST